MNVVGRVGSLISQGVYSVATPFHPFGGAVDIIVVEQEDGTYRSTPWYVRFGKFQGVLKSAEKVVSISVNGIEASFHMYLDNSGEAYFMREVPPGGKDDSNDAGRPVKLEHLGRSGSFGDNLHDNNESFDGRKEEEPENEELETQNDHSLQEDVVIRSDDYHSYQYGSLDDVESVVESVEETNSEMVLISVDGHILTAPILSMEQNIDNVQLITPQFHLGPGEGSGDELCGEGNAWEDGLFCNLDVPLMEKKDAVYCMDGTEVTEEKAYIAEPDSRVIMESSDWGDSSGMQRNDTFKSCLDFTLQEYNSQYSDPPSTRHDLDDAFANLVVSGDQQEFVSMSTPTLIAVGENEDQIDSETIGDPECSGSSQNWTLETVNVENKDFDCNMSLPLEHEKKKLDGPPIPMENILEERTFPFSNIPLRSDSIDDSSAIPEMRRSISNLGLDISLCGNLLHPGMGRNSAEEVFEAHRVTEEEFKASGSSIIKNVNLIVRYKDMYLKWDKCAHIILGIAVFGSDFPVDQKDSILIEHGDITIKKDDEVGVSPSVSRRWRLWPIPFRRVKSFQQSSSSSSTEDLFLDSEPAVQSPSSVQISGLDGSNHSPYRQYIRTKVPTTEQIASLNLKDGQNIIAFSFSTRVLGKQQVDAHIYLWKWNARIVISDVDGTITKSDVLGQFMPLVGRDWTQTGVARLFSAIKENGYQLLFLSARAIVQAYLTRSFLLNLKQDGKALPNGPVVISPDGLFPSLYREVIRRAPHEFKIACLEDIRALFPSDYNPFYAGFGNRDTDELSYRKIGISKGKIFIINPKGEVAINHRIHVKTYTSLHTLVNDMFPPTSLVEQEDFNSWNYWKVPLPAID